MSSATAGLGERAAERGRRVGLREALDADAEAGEAAQDLEDLPDALVRGGGQP